MNNSTNATLPSIKQYLFSLDPGMKTWELIVITVVYSMLSAAIIIPNYLTLRALYTTKTLMYRHKYLLGNLAFADLAVGLVSVPAYAYNMMEWPTYGYLVYEGLDAWVGFASVFTLAALWLRTFTSTLRPASRSVAPSGRSQCCLLVAVWFVAALVAALNLICILELFPFITYIYYFYVVVGFLVISGLVILVSCFGVMALSCICCKKKTNNDSKENRGVITSIFIVTVIYIVLWMFPYIYFTYNRVCELCAPTLPAKFFYTTRMLLYIKSIISPIVYIRRVMSFYGAIMRILTRECFAAPSG